MGRKVTGPEDINVRRLIRRLEKTKINAWKTIAETLKKARRKRVEANLGHINRVTDDGDVVVVPGKILGAGNISKKLTIAALGWSAGAQEKIQAAGSTLLTIDALLDSNPSRNIKIIK